MSLRYVYTLNFLSCSGAGFYEKSFQAALQKLYKLDRFIENQKNVLKETA
jgi:hypothetical protein